jgi:hypothetical protein
MLRRISPVTAIAAALVLASACASSNSSDETPTPTPSPGDDGGTGGPADSGGAHDAGSSRDTGASGDATPPSGDDATPPGDDSGSQADAPATQDDSSTPDDSGGGGDAPPAPAGVTVDPTKPGNAITNQFIGFSAEWGTTVRTLIGDGTGKAQKPTVTLFKSFAAEGNHPPLRVGGNSADEAYYLPNGGTLPTGLKIPIKATDIAGLTDLNAQTGASMIPDLNLVLGDATNSSSFIQALQAAFPAGTIRAFEIGNEPDNWEAKMLRPAGYTFADWTAEYDKMTAALNVILKTAPPYAGPGTFTPGPWFDGVDTLYAHEKSNLSLATLHRYPYTNCAGDNTRPTATTPEALLASQGTTDLVALFAPHVAAARAANVELRVGEFNSIACSGVSGVSDSYAEALWAADATMELATAGVDAVNFHMSASSSTTTVYYDAWQYSGTTVTVLPLYYGLRLASMTIAGGGKLLPVTVNVGATVHGFATLGSDGKVRVLLVSLDTANGGMVSVNVPGAKSASLVRMHAPMLSAKTGITLGTQTWDGSTDGTPMGTATSETLTIQGGAIAVPLPALDAVVITVTM